MLLYFVRHGQTDDNVQGIIQGQLDTPLNDHGKYEATLCSERLKDVRFDEIWSSDLSRASETAYTLAQPHGLPVVVHPGLRERHLGSLQGRMRSKDEKIPSDAESTKQFRQRILDFFLFFLQSHQNLPSNHTILLVSHGAYLANFLQVLLTSMHFSPPPESDLRRRCLNTSIMRVSVEMDDQDKSGGSIKGEVISWGEVEHLAGLFEPPPERQLADDVSEPGALRLST
ncbi:hypothetical protein M231_00455 [Tremella mesenterica]|uniref:Phosphoglycerate mutase n=1 Tax=Tremella mesenterica TaxID=5217 RepID=A0A4Q1BVG1_TREME|nr:hypothetical protein M231_00455 [Tremella mesenterica]